MIPIWMHTADFHQATWANGLVLSVYPMEDHRWKWEFRVNKKLLRCGTGSTNECAIRMALDQLDEGKIK